MPENAVPRSRQPEDDLPGFARADLERLKLAAEVILRLAGDDVLTAPLEAELTIFADRLERALLAG